MTLDALELLARYPVPFTPHGIQIEDIQELLHYRRVGMFLPVGYGKTFIGTHTMLGWDDDMKVVAVLPILVPQWVKWLNSVVGKGSAVAYEGSPKQRKELLASTNASWYVMSYGVFRNDIDLLIDYRGDCSSTLMVDEAQNIKNSGSKLFKCVDKFSAGHSLILATGTEMNKPIDAYAYIKLKTHNIYRSLGHFTNLHVTEWDFFNNPVRWSGLDTISHNLYQNSVHRTKEEVHAHLPQPNYIPIYYDLHPDHKALYDKIAEELIAETEKGGKIDGSTPQKLRNVLQQIVINWDIFSENPNNRSAFYDVLDSVMDEIDVQQEDSSKLIVWTWFKNSSRSLTHYLNEIGVPAVAAYGEVNSRKSVELFMDDPKWRTLVAQPGSAGAGLNPQYICWECIFGEIPTTSIPFRQAAGRIDREGQRFRPNIRIAIANGTVQAGMYRSLLENDGLIQKVQGNEFDLRKLVYG